MSRSALLLVVVLAGCGGDGGKPSPITVDEPWEGEWTPAPVAGAEVIAEVNGAKIYELDVRRQARDRQLTPRAALDELIEMELLAQEARDRGLVDDPDVAAARKRLRVRLINERVFEPTFDGPEDVLQADVDATWGSNKIQYYYNHEHYQLVAYARVPVDESQASDEAVWAERGRLAAELRAELVAAAPRTKEDFGNLAVAAGKKRGVEVQTQVVSTTRHTTHVEEFAAAAFSIDEIGEIAQPARTKWGWDILYLYDVIPERRTSKAEAEPEIRANLYEEARLRSWYRWTDGYLAKRTITRDEEWLERIQVTGGIDLFPRGSGSGGGLQ